MEGPWEFVFASIFVRCTGLLLGGYPAMQTRLVDLIWRTLTLLNQHWQLVGRVIKGRLAQVIVFLSICLTDITRWLVRAALFAS